MGLPRKAEKAFVIERKSDPSEVVTYHDVRIRRLDVLNWVVETQRRAGAEWVFEGYYSDADLDKAAKAALSMLLTGGTDDVARMLEALEAAAKRLAGAIKE